MSYLKFDKTVMANLEKSLTREILRTNRKGAYHCTTVVDCNTRKYHGLLVMPVPALGEDNFVLLSSLDETVIQHGAEFNLGLHKYQGDNFSPNGHKYIREYECDNIPRTVYRVGGVILSKEKVFSLSENRIMIKYTLEDAHSPTTLKFRPFLAFRSVNELTHANDAVNKNYEVVPNGIKTRMYPGYPDLFMQFSKKVKFVFDPKWYYGVEYTKEQERGYPYQEDLYVPGYFEVPIKKGESIYFSAGETQAVTTRLKSFYDEEVSKRTPRTSFYNCLKNSAQQFYISPKGEDAYLLAGYPWFKVRARDLFYSLPGCALSIGEPAHFEKVMATAMPACEAFMHDGYPDQTIQEIDNPDVPLLAIWAIQQYAKNQGIDRARELYGTFVKETLEYVTDQKHPGLRVADNGLLYAESKGKAITWMNSTIDGKPVVNRSGYIVEFNALWYNALRFYNEELSDMPSQKYDILIDKINRSFAETFMNSANYLFDYVDDGPQDWSVRPNMIFAAALEYSPLTRMQKRAVIDIVTKELLTPKGLRSLSPKSEGYKPYYVGPQYERNLAYHQGTAWPCMLGLYLEAYINVFGRSGVSFAERMLTSMEEEMSLHCIGTIPELFDGNPPFIGRGAVSFAPNVSAMLRVVDLLKKYNTEEL
jgi:predicted glycogen debranching enzyme